MKLIRVFPRRTKATPDDALALCREPDLLDEADEVHVSVAFTWDKPRAEQLAEAWRHVAPVKVGGPAYGNSALEFVPGRYIKHGYTITSRGCPRRCWFCKVWKRHPEATPLPAIAEGWNVLDDNLLACPRPHVEAVFDMLRRQKRRAEFTGGLEALSLQDYQVDLLASLTPKPCCFFAYDPGDEFETLADAARRLLALSEQGIGRRAVQAATDIGSSILQGIRSGTKKKIRARTERKILAVTKEMASDHTLIPAADTWALINKLIAEGYTKALLAELLGYSNQALQFRRDQITVLNAHEIRKLYNKLEATGFADAKKRKPVEVLPKGTTSPKRGLLVHRMEG